MATLTQEQVIEIVKSAREKGERPDLSGADLSAIDLSRTNLTGANLSGVNLNGGDLMRTILSGADLSGADLSETDLSEADLSRAHLEDVTLEDADLEGANLEGAHLNRANLSGVHLNGADLIGADLSEANLSEAACIAANLMRANLGGANLSGTYLSGSSLMMANLSGANLSRTNLIRTNLRETELSHADLSEAIVWDTRFGNLDLRTVHGLETIIHKGPSPIDLDTLYRSKGEIPAIFLRGAGVSDRLINGLAALIADEIQYASCFISYAGSDQAFAKRLHTDLQENGVRCWFDSEDMKIGDDIQPRIDEAVRRHDKLVLIVSAHSVAAPWIQQEVARTISMEEKRATSVLCLIRLDEALTTSEAPWVAQLAQRTLCDFQGWETGKRYQAGFEQLLQALKLTPNG